MKDILYIFPTNRCDLEKEVDKNKSPDNALYGQNYMRNYGYSTDIAYASPSAEKFLDIIFSPLHWLFKSQVDVDFKLGRALLLIPVINKYRVIITNTDGINLAICFLKRLKIINIPVIYAVGLFYIQGELVKTIKNNKESFFLKFYKWILNGADHITYHAPIEKDKLLKLGLYNPAKCTYIAMGSDGQFFSNPSTTPEDGSLIVSVGKDRARDYKTLIDSANKLTNYKFVIICRRKSLEGLVIPANVQTFFDIPYFDVAAWYRKASIIVIPIKEMNRSSGQMTLTDAIQSSKPIIISDVVGIAHYNLKNGQDLIKVKPESAEELACAIKKLSSSKVLREKFKKSALNKAKVYNTLNYAKQIARVVNLILNPLKLVPISGNDLDFLRNSRNGMRNNFLNNKLITAESQEKWYRQYLKRDNDYMFILEKDNLRIGAGGIYDIDNIQKVAEIGRLFIKSEFQNSGYGKFLLTRIQKMAVNELGIKKLILKVLIDNVKAVNLYESVGFKIEGVKNIKSKRFMIMTKQ